MVFIGSPGSWNFEIMATMTPIPRSETPVVSVILAVLWVGLLLSVAGLKEHAWFLVGIGGLGMLQNVYAAGTARRPETAGLQVNKFSRMPTIIGKRQPFDDDKYPDINLNQALRDVSPLSDWLEHQDEKESMEMPQWLNTMEPEQGNPSWLVAKRKQEDIANVHGALNELEKWGPGAGLAMLQIFFPTGLRYEDRNVMYNMHKKFWKQAWATRDIRRRAENARRVVERNRAKNDNISQTTIV